MNVDDLQIGQAELTAPTRSSSMESLPWKQRRFARKLAWTVADLQSSKVHAGLVRRVGANLIDAAIISTISAAFVALGWLGACMNFGLAPVSLVAVVLVYSLVFLPVTLLPFTGPIFWSCLFLFGFLNCVEIFPLALPIIFAPLLVDLSYRTLMESSSKQATIGKMLFRIQVVDMNGRRISLWRSYERYFAQILSSFCGYAGYVAIGLASKPRGFHDMIAHAYVVRDFDAALLTSCIAQIHRKYRLLMRPIGAVSLLITLVCGVRYGHVLFLQATGASKEVGPAAPDQPYVTCNVSRQKFLQNQNVDGYTAPPQTTNDALPIESAPEDKFESKPVAPSLVCVVPRRNFIDAEPVKGLPRRSQAGDILGDRYLVSFK